MIVRLMSVVKVVEGFRGSDFLNISPVIVVVSELIVGDVSNGLHLRGVSTEEFILLGCNS
jgi:hypothetical protein